MALTLPGGGRIPGSIGLSPTTWGGRIPGPLGFKHTDVKGAATKAVHTVQMPPPWYSSTILRIRKVPWKLSGGTPATGDVEQGGIPVCPIASILAALAHTGVGRKHLDDMVSEYTGAPVKTVVSDEILKRFDDQLPTGDSDYRPDDYKPQDKEVVSSRYFKVPFWKGEIHDTFYVEYADDDATKLVFMRSPNSVLWPAVIEKACAFVYGSYKEMGNYHKHTVNEFWELLLGTKPQGFDVSTATSDAKIQQIANDAATVPTIAASADDTDRSKVTPFHGHAVMQMRGSTIELYDPAKVKTINLSMDEFRKNFKAVFYGKP